MGDLFEALSRVLCVIIIIYLINCYFNGLLW